MTPSEIAKFAVAIVLGIVTEMFWSMGLEKIAVFILATMVFQIFFVTAERKKRKIKRKSKFQDDMQFWHKSKLLNK